MESPLIGIGNQKSNFELSAGADERYVQFTFSLSAQLQMDDIFL